MDLLVARQPIFDAQLNVRGYEVLFRSSAINAFDGNDGDAATARVINAVLGSVDPGVLLGGKPAFINFPRNLLVNESACVLPPKETVIEVLETVTPDRAVVAACKHLHSRGYRLALDDFVPTEGVHPLIPVADILKVDFRQTSPAQQRSAALRFGSRIHMLAEKVETRKEFQQAVGMGYEYFQGFFFARPVITATKQIPGVKLHYLRIIQELHRPELDLLHLTELLRREPSLSYKLLRFVNSALFARREPIESIHHALAFAGEEATRKWLSVAALLDLAADQPTELAVNTLVRARFSELLAPAAGIPERREDCFLMGMFSRLDAMLGRPLGDLLEGLGLHAEIVRALLNRSESGDRLPDLWQLVRAYESARWEALFPLAAAFHIHPSDLATPYTEAVSWADAVCGL